MLDIRPVLICIGLAFGFGPASAQEAEPSPLEIGPSGEAYLDAIARRGINADVIYYDPDRPPPPLETDIEPEPEQTDITPGAINPAFGMLFWIIPAAILLVVAVTIYRTGSGFGVAVRSDAVNLATGRRRHAKAEASRTTARALSDILDIRDRNLALIALAQGALARAIGANGLLFQRSWTGREALRRLPAKQPHLDVLRDLVRAAERVQFGNRSTDEQEFRAFVDRITPLFQEVAR